MCGVLTRTAETKTLITLAHPVHVDETSTNIASARWWLHVAATYRVTAYHLHRCRGRVAVEEFAILPEFTGIAVHDALSSYDTYLATHARCGAHLARELTAAAAHPHQVWPPAAFDALFGLAEAARGAGLPARPAEIADPLHRDWHHALLWGLATHPRVEGRKQTKTRNLLGRLRGRDEQVLRFARDLTVPFTNTQAERDLRPAKTQVKVKVSGCARAGASARCWLRVRGYLSTARKHGINTLAALRDTIVGCPGAATHTSPEQEKLKCSGAGCRRVSPISSSIGDIDLLPFPWVGFHDPRGVVGSVSGHFRRSEAEQISELVEANEALAGKLARLEHLLSRNSGNSSNPPSRDDIRASPHRRRRRGAARVGRSGRGASSPARRDRIWRGPRTPMTAATGSPRAAVTAVMTWYRPG
ncbi:MAG: transposase [Actinobacteria bacterium]|nr:transposase [Actinomycetota bacterium]